VSQCVLTPRPTSVIDGQSKVIRCSLAIVDWRRCWTTLDRGQARRGVQHDRFTMPTHCVCRYIGPTAGTTVPYCSVNYTCNSDNMLRDRATRQIGKIGPETGASPAQTKWGGQYEWGVRRGVPSVGPSMLIDSSRA